MNNLGAIFPRLQRVGRGRGGAEDHRRAITENGSYLDGRSYGRCIRAYARTCTHTSARVRMCNGGYGY